MIPASAAEEGDSIKLMKIIFFACLLERWRPRDDEDIEIELPDYRVSREPLSTDGTSPAC